jgi:DNA polymerase
MDVNKELIKLKEDCKAFFKDIYKFQDTLIVFGQGNPKASIVLVGEAPGREEVVQQTPFVGKAGGNLNEFLHVLGKKREDIYITNVVKFRPVKIKEKTGASDSVSNRAPSKEEIELSRGWLYKEINIIKPDIVVSLGNIALKALAQDESLNIGLTHGRPVAPKEGIFHEKLTLFPLYHPASIIYRRNLREVYIEDIEKLREFLCLHSFF